MIKRFLALLLLLLPGSAWATTTVTGSLKNLGTGAVTGGAFVRFWLRGCAGNQPRVNGTGLIAPSQGGVFFFDLSADASGNIAGTIYSTRDATGLLAGDIECGGSKTSVWYGMQTFVGGKGGPEIPVHALNTGTLDISNVTPITTTPVITAPTGDSTYLRKDAGNSPLTGPLTSTSTISDAGGSHSGLETFNGGITTTTLAASGITNANGDLLAKSGRPWYDVMAFGAKNDNVTDDTAAIQATVTAACATTYKGGTIYFPPGAGYRSANTGVSPITVSCDNLNFQGAGYNTQNAPTRPPSIILCPACTVPLFTDGGTQRFGFQVRFLGLSGNTASAGSTGISLGNVGDYTVENNFFDSFGGPAFVVTTGFSGLLKHNFAQNCLMQRPATVDTGCFDLGNADTENYSNFVTPSVPTAAGNIGTGHTYAWVVRGANGFFFGNMGEISQHGWLISGSFNTLIGNRAFLIQGNGFTVSGNSNILTGNKALDVSQNANGTFDGFLLSSAITLGGNILSENLVDNTGAGNGNNVRHAITDANSAGASEFNANKHSNNRLRTNLATGVLYNMTGAAPTAIQQPHRQSGDRGDASVTVQCGLDAETQVFQTALTANRTITFSSTGAYNGCRFRVIRNETATGAFNLSTVTGGSNATLALINQYADVEFLVGVWRVTAFGSGLSTTGSGQVALGTSPTLTTPTLTGLTNGTGLQFFNTTTTCTTGASVGAICTTAAITLPVAYADTNYRVACTGLTPTNVPIVQTVAKSNTTFTITIAALTAAAATFTSYDCHVGHN